MIGGGDPEENTMSLFNKINRFEVEENAIFIEYSKQKLQETLQNYSNLKPHHRLSLSKNISVIDEVCQKKFTCQFFHKFATDSEEMQSQLISYLFIHHDNFQNQAIIEILLKLIQGPHFDIKQKACDLLSQVSQQKQKQSRKHIIQFAWGLLQSEEEENKIVGIQLIAKMSPGLNIEEAEELFLLRYSPLYKDSSVRVKKQLITSCYSIGLFVTKSFLQTEIITKFYLQKCKQSIWGVRKACVQLLPKMIRISTLNKQALNQALLNLLKDGNKIVRISAFKVVPEFIANYDSQRVPNKIFQIYLGLLDNDINQSFSSVSELPTKVAYYFPGVMLNVGVQNWQRMRRLFQKLLLFKNADVCLPIAASLHEVSRIIGPVNAKETMFNAIDMILKDKSDVIILSMIEHLADFVELFEKVTKENLIDVFLGLQKDPKKWRVRHCISCQLAKLAKLYDPEVVFKYLFPITLKLCNDVVCQVRNQAAFQMYEVIQCIKDLELEKQMAWESIKGFGFSESFAQRITFAFMLRKMYKVQNFKAKFGDLILQLAEDSNVLVKISYANIVKQIIQESQIQKQTFRQAIEIFLKDQEEDVNSLFS